MGAVETVLDVVTDNRTYYSCPSCKKTVWAYGSYVGNVCWNCPGTIAHGIIKTTDNVTFGLTSTVIDAAIDNKTEYRCPKCGVTKWAYGVGIGRTCLDCIGESNKGWYNMSEASELELSFENFLSYYNSAGTSVSIKNQTFDNVTPKSNLLKAGEYTEVTTKWACGNNAINICLKMHGYSKQLSSSDYKYNPLGFGWSYERFYEKNIKNNFSFHGWKGSEALLSEPDINWSYIDNTDFKNWSLIIMGGHDFCAHYTIVLGVSNNHKYYLITDQSLRIWLVDVSLFRMISTYSFSRAVNTYKQHSIYKVG